MTAQAPEILIYNGREMAMITNPDVNPGCDYVSGFSMNTGNYRGYVGTWEIKDDRKLYLCNVDGGRTKNYPDPVFADWISHDLEVWSGNLLRYVHAGYGSMFEENVIFKIESGILKDVRIEDNTPKFKKLAIEEIRCFKNKANISYLYSIYLDPRGGSFSLQQVIDKSTTRKDWYLELRKELEDVFKERLVELAKDPESGITLVYRG